MLWNAKYSHPGDSLTIATAIQRSMTILNKSLEHLQLQLNHVKSAPCLNKNSTNPNANEAINTNGFIMQQFYQRRVTSSSLTNSVFTISPS